MHNGMGMPLGMGMPMPGFPMMPGGHVAFPPQPSPVMSSATSPAQAHGRPIQQLPSMNQPHNYPHPIQQTQPARQNTPVQQVRPSTSQPSSAQQSRQQSSPSQATSVQQPRQINQSQPSPPQVRQSNAASVVRTNTPGQVTRPAGSAPTPARPLVNGMNSPATPQSTNQQRPTVQGQPAVQSVASQQPRQGVPAQAARQAAPTLKNGFVTELWVVRHGETPENKSRTIAGQNSSGLTPMGVKQALLLAERLRGMRFHTIFLSDLVRTKQTADPVLKALPSGIPAFTDSRLREKGAGQYEGFKIGYIEQMTRYSGLPHRLFRPPGGESWEDVNARSRSFMKDILEKHCVVTADQERELKKVAQQARDADAKDGKKNGTSPEDDGVKKVLIITHGGFISEFLSFAVGQYGNSSKNCSLSILGIRMTQPGGRPQFWMKLTNDIEHLSTIGAPVPPPNPQPLRRTPTPHAGPADHSGAMQLTPASQQVDGSAEPMRADEYQLDPPNDPGYLADPPNDPGYEADPPNVGEPGQRGAGATVDTDEEPAEQVERPVGHEASALQGGSAQAGDGADGCETPTVKLDGLTLNLHLNGEGSKEGEGVPKKPLLRDAVQC